MNRRGFLSGLMALPLVTVLDKVMPKFRRGYTYKYTYNNQRLAQGIINARIDQLALSLYPMYRVKANGDIEQAYQEMAASEARVIRASGTIELDAVSDGLKDYIGFSELT